MTTTVDGLTGVSQCQPNSVSQGDLASDALGAAALVSKGYQKFPSGLIIQWGTAAIPASNNGVTVSFEIPFPNACFAVTGNTAGGSVTTDVATVGFGSITQSSFNMWTTGAGTPGITWIAIGY